MVFWLNPYAAQIFERAPILKKYNVGPVPFLKAEDDGTCRTSGPVEGILEGRSLESFIGKEADTPHKQFDEIASDFERSAAKWRTHIYKEGIFKKHDYDKEDEHSLIVTAENDREFRFAMPANIFVPNYEMGLGLFYGAANLINDFLTGSLPLHVLTVGVVENSFEDVLRARSLTIQFSTRTNRDVVAVHVDLKSLLDLWQDGDSPTVSQVQEETLRSSGLTLAVHRGEEKAATILAHEAASLAQNAVGILPIVQEYIVDLFAYSIRDNGFSNGVGIII